MKKSYRPKFQCWSCDRVYSLYQEISDEQTLIVACPYCAAEAVVDLKPFRKPLTSLLRGEAPAPQAAETELQLPEIVPTQKPE